MGRIAHFYDVSPRDEVVYVQFNPMKRDLWLAELKQLPHAQEAARTGRPGCIVAAYPARSEDT